MLTAVSETTTNDGVVTDAQSAFPKGRRILNEIFLANEVVDETRKLKNGLLLFRVDFEKVYDSVDWVYLDDVIGKMMFLNLWRKWMKECIGSTTTLILVNDSSTDEFSLERELCQGDPLSPFLFMLAGTGFML